MYPKYAGRHRCWTSSLAWPLVWLDICRLRTRPTPHLFMRNGILAHHTLACPRHHAMRLYLSGCARLPHYYRCPAAAAFRGTHSAPYARCYTSALAYYHFAWTYLTNVGRRTGRGGRRTLASGPYCCWRRLRAHHPRLHRSSSHHRLPPAAATRCYLTFLPTCIPFATTASASSGSPYFTHPRRAAWIANNRRCLPAA